MADAATLDRVVALARQLSPGERRELIAQLTGAAGRSPDDGGGHEDARTLDFLELCRQNAIHPAYPSDSAADVRGIREERTR